DRYAEIERCLRINEIDELCIERAGERGEECTDHEDFSLDARRVDTDRFGGVLVLTDGDAIITDARALDPSSNQKRDREQAEYDVIIRRFGFELHHQRRVAEIGDRSSLRTPREIAKLEEDQHQDLCGPAGGNGEIRPAQPETQPTNRQAGEHGDEAASDHADPWGNSEIDLKKGRCIGAEAEERGMPERKLLGGAAQQVPGRAYEGERPYTDQNFTCELGL